MWEYSNIFIWVDKLNKEWNVVYNYVSEKWKIFRYTEVYFWNFNIFSFVIISRYIYNNFPLSERELEALYDYYGVFLNFFFYVLCVFFATLSTSFLGVRGVYILTGWGIFFCWYSLYENIDFFFMDATTKYYKSNFNLNMLNLITIDFSLNMDKISFCFCFLTISIGLCASIYSLTYFKNEPHADRFILLLHWFIISMSLLVLADNAILMFLGWELIGLTSFLLINFWTLRRGTIKSAFKAFTFNKVSDIFILLFIVFMIKNTQTTNMSVWIYLAQNNSLTNTQFFTPIIFLILGSSIKSAQLVGHLWLPDSMEAPIPASALIHSATLVSAGIYLLLRLQTYIYLTNLQGFVFFLGSITAFYGAVVSSAQTDAKKLLAYSTISHCGFLFVTVSIGYLELTLLYLYLHGFFKALTFFCVGNIIKLSRGYQDTRLMGQFSFYLPVESVLFLVSAVNLGGLPFTVGFYYKHLFQLLLINNNYNVVFFSFLMLAMLSSIVYVFRLVFYVLFDFRKGQKIYYEKMTQNNLNYKYYMNTTHFSISVVFFGLYLIYILYRDYFFGIPTDDIMPGMILYNTADSFKESVPYWLEQTFFAVSYFIFFCAIFLPVTILLLISECRYSFSSNNRKFLFIYLFFLIAIFFNFLYLGVGTNIYGSVLSK